MKGFTIVETERLQKWFGDRCWWIMIACVGAVNWIIRYNGRERGDLAWRANFGQRKGGIIALWKVALF